MQWKLYCSTDKRSDLEAQGSCFLKLIFHDVTNKGYGPFGNIFLHYSLNWISSVDYNFFQSISKRLYILGVLQRLTTAMFDPH